MLISLSSETQTLNSFENFAENFLSYAFPIAAQTLMSRNCILMVKGEHIPSGSNTAESNERKTILWTIFDGTSCSVPRQTMRLSTSKFQLSPRIDDDCGSISKVFTTFVDLSALGFVIWLLRHLLSISLTWIQFCWGCLWVFGKFQPFLAVSDWLQGVLQAEILLDSFDECFVVFCVILRHLMQSVLCTSRRTHHPKNVSCILVDFYPLLWIFSPEKL